MGCGSSSDKHRAERPTAAGANNSDEKQQFPGIPDNAQQAANKNFGLTNHTIIKPLGVGGTGETWLCKRNDTGQEEAVKVISRGPVLKTLQKLLTNEITLQAELAEGHINIVDMHEVLLTESHLCLFMEYISGGTLTDYVSGKADTAKERNGLFLDEDEARYLFRQCISAVEFCHARNVAHRDLKLDNTLLDENTPPHVKICDFGFAKLMGDNSKMTTGLGTAVYMAPQQIQKQQGKGYDGRAADVWACGVLLFVMLLGAFPFEHSTAAADEQRAFNEVHFEQIRIHWTENERNKEIVKRMSPECKDLLDRIFKIQETERITIPEIKQHPWYCEALPPKYKQAMDEVEQAQAALEQENKLARQSTGASSQQEQIKQVVQCAAMSREGNVQQAHLEGKEIFLTRMHAKVQTGAVQLPAAVVHKSDIRTGS